MSDLVDAAAASEPRVLELRVHGVNNTTPAALLDLPQDDIQCLRGDDRSAFWLAAPRQNPPDRARGHIPAGIRREAYSWGGLVRSQTAKHTASRSIALAFQVLALPFSIGNGAMWTRHLPHDSDAGATRLRANVTAAAARLFGFVLTLLFTTTAVTVAVDLIALQCSIGGQCSAWPSDLLGSAVASTPGLAALLAPSRVLALLAVVPVLGVGLLVLFARIARMRYDTLHTQESAAGAEAREAMEAAKAKANAKGRAATPDRRAVLAQPAFWSNRTTGHLALVHFAAAIALTTAQVSWHLVALDASSGFPAILWWAAVVLLVLSAVAAAILPTMTITPSAPEGPRWSAWLAQGLLALAMLCFALLLVLLVLPSAPDLSSTDGLAGDELPPLLIVTLGGVLALSGVAWRPRGSRAGTAWLGSTPAVFMLLSLTVGVLTSSAVIALTTIVVAGWGGPAALVAGAATRSGLHVPDVFLALGGMIAVALLLSVVVLVTFLIPRKLLADRAKTWLVQDEDDPLRARLERDRRRAAFIHLIEPATGIIATLMAVAIGLALTWVWAGVLWQAPLPGVASGAARVLGIRVADILVLTTWSLTVVGVGLAAIVALGVLLRKPGLLAIVWDITCYLPRTAQPFGPPCYAEHAVPDIAQELDVWLCEHPDRRAVLAAHSMGAVIAVSALGLLAATTRDPTVVDRVALLTFGSQLRTYFGRMMPELVGPAVLGTYPARGPRPWKRDPWSSDALDDDRAWDAPPTQPSMTRLGGALLPGDGVPWINLWRLSDYLGFPAVAGRTSLRRGETTYQNAIDRYAQEIDRTIDPPLVVTHNDYFRVPAYQDALLELLGGPEIAERVDGGSAAR